jgi:hypothetical protein
MLDDLDRTLRALLIDDLPRVIEKIEADGFEVRFDVPNREFRSRLSKPTLNLYLYNIQENRDMRGRTWDQGRTNGSVTTRRPPVRLDCSYLVTAWSNEVEDEHRLLTGAARVLFRNPTLPEEVLQGALADGYAITTEVAQPESLKDIVDVWSVLDNDLRPSVRVTVTVPLEVEVEYHTPPVLEGRFLGPDPSYMPPNEDPVRMEGTLLRDGKPVANARMRVELSSSITDDKGTYVLRSVRPGKRTVFVDVDGVFHQFQAELPGDGNIDLAAFAESAEPKAKTVGSKQTTVKGRGEEPRERGPKR